MEHQQWIGTKIVTARPEEKYSDAGYSVTYDNGYESWSPKAAFESAYTTLGQVYHLPPHQQRVIGETVQLNNNLTKLQAFLEQPLFNTLTEAEQSDLKEQATHMHHYLVVLKRRCSAFGFNL